MSTYKMPDGRIVNTDNAVHSWSESTKLRGLDKVSVHTNSQWWHETLHKSPKGQYYIESGNSFGTPAHSSEYATQEEAAVWLHVNGSPIPDDLLDAASQVEA